MKQELLDQLYKDYPVLFIKISQKNSPYGEVYVGDGWYSVIDTLCAVLTEHIMMVIPQEIHEQVFISLIKEKFGTMRFHINHWDDFMMGAITMAEAQSGELCEECGSVARLKNVKGWYRTLCEEDFVKAMEAKR